MPIIDFAQAEIIEQAHKLGYVNSKGHTITLPVILIPRIMLPYGFQNEYNMNLIIKHLKEKADNECKFLKIDVNIFGKDRYPPEYWIRTWDFTSMYDDRSYVYYIPQYIIR